MPERHGGQILVDQLKIQGIDRVFCIPGESYLAALDGLYQSGIDTIVCRNEGGAAMAAEADGKISGKPGVAFVTRGPGATNASGGVHVALQDSTPMILFVGQVASDQKDREAFQEVDYRAMFGPLAKWVAEIDRTDRIPEYVSRAFHVAQSGRPGPVVLSLPEDMLSARVDVADARPVRISPQFASDGQIAAIHEALGAAERPMVILGGPGWSAEAADNIGSLAEKLNLPVGVSFRCQSYMDNVHPNYVGDVGIGINPALAERVRTADLLLVLGARLGEMTTSGYSLVNLPVPKQTLIHVFPGADELGRVYAPDLGIVADPGVVVGQLLESVPNDVPDRPETVAARAEYEAWQEPHPSVGDVRMENVVGHLRDVLPEDAFVANGAGNYAGWLHRYFRHRRYRTQVSPTSGTMGYGLPAALAAKLRHPDRDVICMAGDGCFQMNMQEFGTACQYGANMVVIVSNNGVYGTIRMHQNRDYPGRPSGTDMVNPDFAALARSYGAHGESVEQDADFPGALERARSAGRPALIDLKTSPNAVSTMKNIEAD